MTQNNLNNSYTKTTNTHKTNIMNQTWFKCFYII